jgi:hypothetical protein
MLNSSSYKKGKCEQTQTVHNDKYNIADMLTDTVVT